MVNGFSVNSEFPGVSFYRDTITTTYNKLKVLFGEPEYYGDDKVTYEWNLIYKGIPFTIYDWKEYCEFGQNEVITWHIGALSSRESTIVYNAISKLF